MKATKLTIWFSLLTILLSCSNWNSTTNENEKLKERINEEIKDSLRIDSIHKNELNAISKDSIIKNQNSGKYLLSLSDLIAIYSIEEIDNKKILSSLKKINRKWKMFEGDGQTANGFYFIFSLEDEDQNKASDMSFNYKSNILQYNFYDKENIEKVYKELIKNKFVLYSDKKVERGDAASYMSDEYNISIVTIDAYTIPNAKDYSIYLMRR